MRRWPVGLLFWLLVLASAETAALLLVWHFFVGTRHGQLLDTVALDGNSVGLSHIERAVDTILNAISLVSLIAATAVVSFIALIRRRVVLAFGTAILVIGANATAQLLKHYLVRPDLGVDPERVGAGNSLPSGHTTIAASVAVALILALPVKARGVAAILGAVFAGAAGVATLSAGWHRPSDAMAALLVVGVWTSLASIFIVVAQRRHGDVDYGAAHPFAILMLLLTGLALLIGAGIAVALTNGVLDTAPEDLSRNRLLVGYAGGALAIAATVCLVYATVLVTVHRVVPQALQDHREYAGQPT